MSAQIVIYGEGFTAVYGGGAYIDVFEGSTSSGVPSEVINVFDYAAGKPSIPFTVEAVQAAVDEFWKDVAEAEAEV